MQWKRIAIFAASQTFLPKTSEAFCVSTRNLSFLRSSKFPVARSGVTELRGRGRGKEYSKSTPTQMPRGVKKENLPSKICVTCGRPFTWRKKWERVWDEVTTCSKSCNHKRRVSNRQEKTSGKIESTSSGPAIDERSSPHKTVSAHEQIREEILSVGGSESDTEGVRVVPFAGLSDEASECSDPPLIDLCDDPAALAKKERKALKKAKKAERRAQREGRGDPSAGQKCCDMCGKSVDLLIRCMYEEDQVDWKMVCGKCWNVASGGVVDGDKEHPHYRYGGLWKNRRAQS